MKNLITVILVLVLTSCAVRVPDDAIHMTIEGYILHSDVNKKGDVLALHIYNLSDDVVYKVCNVDGLNIRLIQDKSYIVEVTRILTDKRSDKRKAKHAKRNPNRWESSKRYSKYQYNFKNIW